MKKEYKAYCFDLYGTLIDIHTDESMPKVRRTMAGFFTEHGADYSPREFMKAYRAEIKKDEQQIQKIHPEIRHPEADLARVLAALFREKGVDNPETAVIEASARTLRAAAMCHIRPYAGAVELLSALGKAGKKVFLVSNAQHLFTMPELEKTGLLPYFDDILISSDEGMKKPEPAFFKILPGRWGIKPEECLMIGNDLACDIEGARSAGMDGYYILSGISPQKDKELFRNGRMQKLSKDDVLTKGRQAEYVQIGMNLAAVRRNLLQ